MRRCREGARQRLGSGRSMCGGVGTPLGGDVNVVHDFARHKVPQTGGVLSVPQGLKSFTFGSGIDFSSEPFGYEFARELPGSQAFSARIRRNPTFSALTGKITHFKKNGCLDRCRGRLGFSAAAASLRAAERSMRDIHRSPGVNCGWRPRLAPVDGRAPSIPASRRLPGQRPRCAPARQLLARDAAVAHPRQVKIALVLRSWSRRPRVVGSPSAGEPASRALYPFLRRGSPAPRQTRVQRLHCSRCALR